MTDEREDDDELKIERENAGQPTEEPDDAEERERLTAAPPTEAIILRSSD
jgi:hypothetical protein